MEMCTGPILIISCCKFVIQVGFQLGAIQFDEVDDVNSLQMCTSNKDRICQWITSHRWPLNCAVNNNTTAALTLPLYNSCNYDRPSNPPPTTPPFPPTPTIHCIESDRTNWRPQFKIVFRSRYPRIRRSFEIPRYKNFLRNIPYLLLHMHTQKVNLFNCNKIELLQ